jgi:predicted HicB family RNase H-like nuclease
MMTEQLSTPKPPREPTKTLYLRVPVQLHGRIQIAAFDRYTSMNRLVMRWIREGMDRHREEQRAIQEAPREPTNL